MSRRAFTAVIGTLLTILVAANAPAALAAFGVEEANFEAGTCEVSTCTYASPPSDFYTQAAGHPEYGITSFELNSEPGMPNLLEGGKPTRKPVGEIKRVRVDIPPGLAADPESMPRCKKEEFEAPGGPLCSAESKAGVDELTIYKEVALGTGVNATVTASVYNLEQPEGLPLEFGIYTAEVPGVAKAQHVYLEGHVAWWSDYHEYFEINEISREVQLLKSKLIFEGRAPKKEGQFITLPSECSSSTTSYLEAEPYEGEIAHAKTTTPVGVEKCGEVPFAPVAEAKPETSASDAPDGITAEVRVPQNPYPKVNTADLKDIHVLLPEGLTMNPSAARGLGVCTAAQIAIGSTAPVTCPASAKIGEITIETDLPPGSLKGPVYLGSPGGGPITGPPYTIYVDAESRYGVSVRLQGKVEPNPITGRLETTFASNPQLPFSDAILTFKGGATAPLANPLACGTSQTSGLFTPYTGLAPASSLTPFTTTGCSASIPFSLAQGTATSSPAAGASTSYTFNLTRSDGQQYLSQVRTVLPPGLVGLIPTVTLCPEAQANAGTCPNASQIGVATVKVGAGSSPYEMSGPVFLTGPFGGGPYGLSVVIPAVAGPFNLGNVVTRASINVDPYSARVIVTSTLPRVVGGVPLRLKGINVDVNRPGFLLNPTSCAQLATESTLGGFILAGAPAGAVQSLSSPFQLGGCGALKFTPAFKASTSSRTSRAQGASLTTTIVQPGGQANIASVQVSLPKQLPSRLSTLQKACPEATFAANPASGCPSSSDVGTVTVSTPVLPTPLKGPAFLVSHGGAAFPDLDLVLEGSGVRVILVGNTDIKKGITTTRFASTPDVPVSSVKVELPMGPHSALAAYGNFCTSPLIMPTTIEAHSGAVLRQNTVVSVSGCGVRIIRRRVRGKTLYLTIQTFSAGKVTVSGRFLRTTSRRLRRPSRSTTLKIRLTGAGRRHHHLRVRVKVVFRPSVAGVATSKALTRVAFR